MRIGKIASSVEYRMDEENCQFLKPNFDFRNWKKLQISQFSNSNNSKNFAFWKFKKKKFNLEIS